MIMARIVHCIIVDDEPVAREILEDHLSRIDHFRVVASCKNAVEAFRAVSTHPVDLVFLDISMPEISGLSFAKSVSRDLKIIFTTAYREYAADGFDLMAVDYLLKPISFERLLQAVNKYLEESASRETDPMDQVELEKDDSFFVRSERKMVRVQFDEIRYIESLGDYVKIHLDGQKMLVTRDTLSSIEGRLPGRDFLRTHRSFIVSLAKIESFTSESIGMSRHEIPISRSYREAVMKRLGG